MRCFPGPRIVMSKCIEFDQCLHGCSMIPIELVRAIKFHVDYILVCACADATVDIGQDISRDTIRLVSVAGQIRLMQQSINLDLIADRIGNFCWRFLAGLA
ncbi:MAG TPA: hypothetical protein PKL29_08865 [Methanothrix sp.]|nr:hypothetical protein [Methanothrix sp.]